MHNSSIAWPNTRTTYYNPLNKIRTLIQSLDSELMHLCDAYPTAPPALQPNRSIVDRPLQVDPRPRGNPDGPKIMMTEIEKRALANTYRAKVTDAYRGRRIFTVYGNYNTIRQALLRRGWLEKLAPGRFASLQALTDDVLLQNAKRGNEYEAALISRIINHFPAFFIWQPKGQRDLFCEALPYRNRVRRNSPLDFSTKIGLIGCAEQEQWHCEEGVSGMSYPRFYRLGGNQENKVGFIEDFRLTQCRSLLKYVVEHMKKPEDLHCETSGTAAAKTLQFALTQIEKQLADWKHASIDDEKDASNTEISSVDWFNFLRCSSDVVHGKARFKISLRKLREYADTFATLIQTLEERRPDYKWDGCRNLWILKPGYQCRGIGITIKSSLDDILLWAETNPNRRYIAQKYVERPLLIYTTKFDIRQYMLLVIGASNVSIWLYKDCYLRFSSQDFSIDDLQESIHLTNNSVQKKYKNKPDRDRRLPKCNMWSLRQFRQYLQKCDVPETTWNDKVYSGFKQNLIAVVLASLEETKMAENSFEMYGCDFMLDEQYNPILIEINSTPDLTPSTEVTAQICPMALKDVLKVVVDLPRNSNTNTGLFELVYQVDYKISGANNADMSLSGKSMKLLVPSLIGPIPKAKFARKLPKKDEERAKKEAPSQEPETKTNDNAGPKEVKNKSNEKVAAPKKVDAQKESQPQPKPIQKAQPQEAESKTNENVDPKEAENKSNEKVVPKTVENKPKEKVVNQKEAQPKPKMQILNSVTKEALAIHYTAPKAVRR